MISRLASVLAFASCAALGLVLAGTPSRAADDEKKTPFASFVDDYFDSYFAWKPSEGTAAGLHQYDAQLEDRSAGAVARRIAQVHELQARLDKLRASHLSFDEAIDAEVLNGLLHAESLDLETVGNWRKNPMSYVLIPSGAIDGLMKRNFAPPAERLGLIIARLEKTPALFEALRANIQNPPREFTDLALRMAKGSISFYQDTLTAWAREAAGADKALLARFDAANARVIADLSKLAKWIETDLVPKSKGNFAIGAENFAKQLQYEELVDEPLAKLLDLAMKTLHKDQAAFAAVAKQIDPNKTPAEVMKLLSNDHPTEEDLIPSARRTIESIRKYPDRQAHRDGPLRSRPTVMETPSYARDGSFASMDTPGRLRNQGHRGVLLRDARRKGLGRQAQGRAPAALQHAGDADHHHSRGISGALHPVSVLQAVSHEDAQADLLRQQRRGLGSLLRANDAGRGLRRRRSKDPPGPAFRSDPARLPVRRRHQDAHAGHDGGRGRRSSSRPRAIRSLPRPSKKPGAAPTIPRISIYTLGKLQIYKLRDDYKKLKGPAFSLEGFHNEFVKQGGIPIKLIRKIMLPGDKGPTL